EYSLDNGQTWTRVGNQGDGNAYNWNWYNSGSIAALPGSHGWTGQGEGWQTSKILLDTLVFRNIPSVKFRIRFMSDSQNTTEGIAIDDIKIYDAPGDLGVVSIDYPESGCIQDTGYRVGISIKNFGLDTLNAGEMIIAGYDFEENPTVIDTFVLEADLHIGSVMNYTFKTKFQIESAGWKNLRAFTLLPDDVNFYNEPVSNDSASTTFELRKTPVPSLQENIYTVRPDTLVLDATIDDPLVTYLWQDGSTSSVYQVTDFADGIYSVTTGNGFCDFRDTVYVWRLIADVGVSDIIYPVSDCELGNAVKPVIEIRNFGSDTLYPGDQIPVRYQIDGNAVVEETALVTEIIFPESVFTYTFNTSADFTETRSYSLTAFTEMPYDDTLANDLHAADVTVFGYTPLDLGEDLVIRAFQYNLDAGEGYDSYLWSDGSVNQSLEIDASGTYSVTVQQGAMCPNTDSVSIILVISDITAQKLVHPNNTCELLPDGKLQFYILNSGNDTLMINDTVYITYSMNEGDPMKDSLIIDRRIEPGDSILFTASSFLDMSMEGSYEFSIEVSYAFDLVPENNHLEKTINVFDHPDIDLGNDTVVHQKRYAIDPGDEFVSFLWHDGSTGQQYIADYLYQAPDSLYSVIATDINGCEASDTIKLAFNIHDLGVSDLVSPGSACELNQAEIIIRLKNEGTNTIVNEFVTLYVTVRGGATVLSQKFISGALQPGNEKDLSIGAPIDFSNIRNYELTVSIKYDPDDDSSNDTLVTLVSNYGNPEPDLGMTDTLQSVLPIVLDAGGDYNTYLWNGIPGSRTFEVSSHGWYNLVVTDDNGCSGRDSLYLIPFTSVPDYFLQGNLNVYPQPSSTMMNIEYMHMGKENFILEVFDGNGRVIYNQQYKQVTELKEAIDVSPLTPGIYYLRLRTDNAWMGKKVIVL
ncbi:MAG: T9SS type A sorting domain-containing protein, partial [Bacteroidales bacterium]|nr:T9SS type A sorting domain-containing protein [Bacteroidales bacterium]